MALLPCPLLGKPHPHLPPAPASPHAAQPGRPQRAHSRCWRGAQFSCAPSSTPSLSLSLSLLRSSEGECVRGGGVSWRGGGLRPVSGPGSAQFRGLRAQSAGGARQGAPGGGEDYPRLRFEETGPSGAPAQSESRGGAAEEGQGFRDLRRLGFFVTVLGLATALEVALEGRLGGFVEGALGIVVQLLFAFTAVDLSLTAATWILNLLGGGNLGVAQALGLAQCPWCTGTIKFDRHEAERHFMRKVAHGPESVGASCPNCRGQLAFTGLETEPFFTRRPGAEAPLGVALKRGRWDLEGTGRIVDVEATVYNKD